MIRSEKGNIWDYEASHLIVIPVNIGWKLKGGANIMGKGLALQAADKYPEFALWYGQECQKGRSKTPTLMYPNGPLIAFPVKPLNPEAPWLSWRNKADLGLIERSARELAAFRTDHPIAVSMVGCGAGGLEMSEVRPILDKHLSDDRFTLVLFG